MDIIKNEEIVFLFLKLILFIQSDQISHILQYILRSIEVFFNSKYLPTINFQLQNGQEQSFPVKLLQAWKITKLVCNQMSAEARPRVRERERKIHSETAVL